MKKRTFVFETTHGAGAALHEAVTAYAHTAYPVGGSDCAATTRQALLEVAEKATTTEDMNISTRQRPMLKAAVKWFYTESNRLDDPLYGLLLSQFERKKS